MPTSKLSFMTRTVADVTSLSAPVSKCAADRIDGVRDFERAAGVRPLIQQRTHERRRPALARRIVGRARPHDEPHRHFRLLVMHHDDHLHAVGQGPKLVGRKRDGSRGQRPRWILGRPRRGDLRRATRHQEGDQRENCSEERASHQRLPFGRIFSTRRLSGVKYVLATR